MTWTSPKLWLAEALVIFVLGAALYVVAMAAWNFSTAGNVRYPTYRQ